ncbi:hypothetical protein PR048_020980 [Dryococelus australis]|uniref:Uncharacterized protein n=1 Tax=Dryococelus australis TaxID=614101 RepID=A0ABQ9GWY6_9NEOP|nr:hypothetical protein PR048_020980 [Dryococelus australis]
MLCFDLCSVELSVAFVKYDGEKSMTGSWNFAASFQKFTKKTSPETASKSYSLLKALTESEFIVSVFALGDFIVVPLPPRRLLQSSTLDWVNSSNPIRNVLTLVEMKRNRIWCQRNGSSYCLTWDFLKKSKDTEIITIQTTLKISLDDLCALLCTMRTLKGRKGVIAPSSPNSTCYGFMRITMR